MDHPQDQPTPDAELTPPGAPEPTGAAAQPAVPDSSDVPAQPAPEATPGVAYAGAPDAADGTSGSPASAGQAAPTGKAKAPRKPFVLPRFLKPWPVYLGALVAIGVTVYVTRYHRAAGHADPILPASVQLEQNIEIQFQDVVMQGRQKGVQRWVISAPKVSLSKDGRYTYFAPDPRGEFFNLKDWSQPEGASNPRTRSMVWQAKKAQFDSFTEDLSMEGSAVVTTDAKDVLKTEMIEYHQREKQVIMPKHVDLQMKDGTSMTSDEMKANTDAEVFEMKGHVDLLAPMNDQEKL